MMVTLVSEVATNYLDLRGQQERVEISKRIWSHSSRPGPDAPAV